MSTDNLLPWLRAALADAEAAQRQFAMQEGVDHPTARDWRASWETWGEYDTAPHIAKHLANWSPEVVIAVLAVLRTADAMLEPLQIGAFRVWSCQRCGEETDDTGIITHHPTCEWRMVREALAALAAATT